MDKHELKLISNFLSSATREDVKIKALHELLGFTGSKDGCSLIEDTDILKVLLECLSDKNESACKTACLSLVNISATDSGAFKLMNAYADGDAQQKIIEKLWKLVMDLNSAAADAACMLLSNLTRRAKIAAMVTNYMAEAHFDIDNLVNMFAKISFNNKGCNLDYLAHVFENLSQTSEFRKLLMDKTKYRFQKLLPFSQYQPSAVRRSGIVGTLRNCCFDTSFHEWLLGEDVGILPYLLLPLAGPEEFSAEDNDKLPLELQYLEEDKERESDCQIRKMLLEAIHQLCATKLGREFLRDNNTYLILREFHKWEKDKNILLACENVVDILIRTEEEINEDNLKELNVPESYISQFEEMDKEYLKD